MLVFLLAFLTICYIVDSMSLDKCQEIWLYYYNYSMFQNYNDKSRQTSMTSNCLFGLCQVSHFERNIFSYSTIS